MPFKIDEERLEWDLQQSPSIRLLKADHAQLIIAFLHQQFKYAPRVSIPLIELTEQLDGYLESMNEREAGRYARSAQTYIKEWADPQHQFIRITSGYGSGDVPMVELTADTERAIGWLEDMQRRHFVGTESRFFLIIQLLHDIIQQSTEDPLVRLDQLERQRDELDRQITLIKDTGQVDQRLSPTQLRERFLEASMISRQLLRDFRLVEEKFRDIARELQKAQLQPGARKGELVKYVLDADTALKESEQGRSFYSFWAFLISPSQSEEFKTLLEQLVALPDLSSVLSEDPLLPSLPGYLVNAGEKIVYSNLRLAEQLRRLLDEQMQMETRRVHELILEIKQEIYRLDNDLPMESVLLEVESAPEIQMVMERELWEPAKTQTFSAQPVTTNEEELHSDDLAKLFTQFAVDEALLQRRIETLLERQSQVRLSDVLAHYPAEKGLAEVLTYCSLAAKDMRHSIDQEASEEIVLENTGQPQYLRVPLVSYRRYTHAE
jgi:hypothetical protein